MTRALAHSTRIAVQIVIDDDTGNVAALIMALTVLVGMMVSLGRVVNGCAMWLGDLAAALEFVGKVYVIGFKSLAFGLAGVNL